MGVATPATVEFAEPPLCHFQRHLPRKGEWSSALPYQNRPEIVDVRACRPGLENIVDRRKAGEAVVAIKQFSAVFSRSAEASCCRPVGKCTGIGLRAVDPVRIGRQGGDRMPIDRQSQCQGEFAITAALSAFGAQRDGGFSTGKQHCRFGKGPVSLGDFSGERGMHQCHVTRFTFDGIGQDMRCDAVGARYLGGSFQRDAGGGDDEMFVARKNCVIRLGCIRCRRIEVGDHRGRQVQLVLLDDR